MQIFIHLQRERWILNSISRRTGKDPFTKDHSTADVKSDNLEKTPAGLVIPILDIFHPWHTAKITQTLTEAAGLLQRSFS